MLFKPKGTLTNENKPNNYGRNVDREKVEILDRRITKRTMVFIEAQHSCQTLINKHRTKPS